MSSSEPSPMEFLLDATAYIREMEALEAALDRLTAEHPMGRYMPVRNGPLAERCTTDLEAYPCYTMLVVNYVRAALADGGSDDPA